MISQSARTVIEAQIQSLQSHGPTAHLPSSGELYRLARAEWKSAPTPQNEFWWRRAAICYGLRLTAIGESAEAALAYDANPTKLPFNKQGYVRDKNASNAALATHMLIGEIISRMRVGGPAAGQALALTHTARASMARIDPPHMFGRYRGVVLMLSALALAPRGASAQVREDAVSALTYISPQTQPQLFALAQKYAGVGTGIIKGGRFNRSHRATIQDAECLYHFNM